MIPTFQRPSTLLWSLQSVLKQKFGNANVSKKIFILNNDKASKEGVDESVKKALALNPNHEFDSITIVQGNTEIPAVKNIYGHLKTFTEEGDIAIIHGDDDIMLPHTLLHRYESAVRSQQNVCIAETIWSCFFFRQKEGIYIDTIKDPYQKGKPFQFTQAVKSDITGSQLPFISVYVYKTGKAFWDLYDKAISWSDQLPFEPKVKYPFVPFFIGLAAYHYKDLSVAKEKVVIRGQLFAHRTFLPPLTVTEYANGGIIQLTGIAVLQNQDLGPNPDFDEIRNNYRENTKCYFLQSLCRRDGVSLAKLKTLYQLAKTAYQLKEFTLPVILKNLRNLSDNIFFTKNIKRWITGFGHETLPEFFWQQWDQQNHS
jgi:hypothetical protein